MSPYNLILPPLSSVKERVGGVVRDTAKTAHATLVLVSVGVIATIQDSVNGLRNE
jgi:hypothetical protein